MNSLIEVTQTVLFTPARLLGQVDYSTEGTAPSPFATIIGLLIALVLIVAMWKVFTKAGQPGWASIIPDLQHLHLVQDSRPSMVVDSVDAHSRS